MPVSLCVVMPVYNDWECLGQLLSEIDAILGKAFETSIIVVNDASSVLPQNTLFEDHALKGLKSVEILNLSHSMGHQRAIAVGLAEASKREQLDAVIVMDADGEDQPKDLPMLLSAHSKSPDHIIVANRTKRSEGWLFTFFYLLYRLTFRAMTGMNINFGNFSLIPFSVLKRIVLMPDLWNNLVGTIMKSKIPVESIPTQRGSRYAGHSKMNLVNLVVHGLSSISTFSEICSVRLLMASVALMIVAICAICTVVSIRLFTTYAIPGWASYLVGILVVILIQSITMSMYSLFIVLSSRSNLPVIPVYLSKEFIVSRTELLRK
jgi:polyisoprenyl-phosphate glycosyltransferase